MRQCEISLRLQTMNWGNTNCLWISQISEWPLETTSALICMCSLHNYTFKLGKQFHLRFCTRPSALQGLKNSPSMFYYISYWNLRTFSCIFAFPSPASFCISQCISGYTQMVNQSWLTFCYTEMLIPHLVMSIVQMNCIHGRGLAKPSSLQACWPGNWNEKERKTEDLL